MNINEFKNFYSNKKVIITGHTGFKGSWLTKMLDLLGAKIYGISINDDEDSPFKMLEFNNLEKNIFLDIREFKKLKEVIEEIKPDIIFHLAAQPLVIESYINPYNTYTSNFVGTLNICEILSKIDDRKISFINVTTDKVYLNKEKLEKYTENDYLNGYDPYSNSKSCVELMSTTYKNCIFNNNIIMSNCRSGNVIGGGDFSKNRIVPDIFRAFNQNEIFILRNQNSIRPYQHVLEANFVYILVAMEQYVNSNVASNYNIAPNDESIVNNLELSKMFQKILNINIQVNENNEYSDKKESKLLLLSNEKIKKIFNWQPILNIDECVSWTTEWYLSKNKNQKTIDQILDYFRRWDLNNEKRE